MEKDTKRKTDRGREKHRERERERVRLRDGLEAFSEPPFLPRASLRGFNKPNIRDTVMLSLAPSLQVLRGEAFDVETG